MKCLQSFVNCIWMLLKFHTSVLLQWIFRALQHSVATVIPSDCQSVCLSHADIVTKQDHAVFTIILVYCEVKVHHTHL